MSRRWAFTKDELSEIHRKYEAGELVKNIAADMGAYESSISRAAQRMGVAPRRKPRNFLTDAEVGRMVRLKREGFTIVRIAQVTNRSEAAVSKALKAHREQAQARQNQRILELQERVEVLEAENSKLRKQVGYD